MNLWVHLRDGFCGIKMKQEDWIGDALYKLE